MASTADLISSSASGMSVPGTNSALVVPSPSVAVDKIFLMPSMPWMASSILMQTPCSTSLGAAPRYTTLTEIMSELTDGKTSRFPDQSPINPATKIPTTSRLAATWFLANQSITPFMGQQNFPPSWEGLLRRQKVFPETLQRPAPRL